MDLTNGSRQLQNFNGSSIRYAGDNTNLYFHNILLPFSAFPYSQFSRKLFNQFENCLWIVITVLEFYKKWMEVAAQLSLHFPVKKCVIWNKEKMLNIYNNQTIFIQFSPKSSQCFWPSNSCNRWHWKCRSRQKFTKMIIYDMWIFLKNTPNV